MVLDGDVAHKPRSTCRSSRTARGGPTLYDEKVWVEIAGKTEEAHAASSLDQSNALPWSDSTVMIAGSEYTRDTSRNARDDMMDGRRRHKLFRAEPEPRLAHGTEIPPYSVGTRAIVKFRVNCAT